MKTGAERPVVRLKDVARVELGAQDYVVNSYLDGKAAVAMLIQQRPGSNALATAQRVLRHDENAKRGFSRRGWSTVSSMIPTVFIDESVHAGDAHDLRGGAAGHRGGDDFPAIVARRTHSDPGHSGFAGGHLCGDGGVWFSLNSLSLFGLVLAIGIVVDDAIVVVENVERNLAEGLGPRDATIKAMEQVGGALVAIALVLSAVFVPTAFISGITGQFYRQFALTIAVGDGVFRLCFSDIEPGFVCNFPAAPWGKTGLVCPGLGFFSGVVFPAFQSRLHLRLPRPMAASWRSCTSPQHHLSCCFTSGCWV